MTNPIQVGADKGLEDWFVPSQIIYHSRQVIWTLEHCEERQWPVEPDEYLGCVIIKDPRGRNDLYFYKKHKSSYIEAPISAKHRFRNAYFVEWVELVAEVMSRLERCEADGLLVRAYYIDGTLLPRLARVADMTEDELEYRIKRVIRYMSGWRRKPSAYLDFSKHYSAGHKRWWAW